MGRTEAGRKVLAAADKKTIYLQFTNKLPPEEGVEGATLGTFSKIFIRSTENGYIWDHLDLAVDGMERTSQIAIHEGLHGLGIGGSRRAEALVRLEELRAMGVPINRAAMKQVLRDMDDPFYRKKPWLSGGRTSEHFPGLKF